MNTYLIGISGKIGSGKTTLSNHLKEILENKFLNSNTVIYKRCFGDSVKEETSKIYGYDLSWAYSQDKKLNKIILDQDNFENKKLIPNYNPDVKHVECTIRDILQHYGTDFMRNNLDANHWVTCLYNNVYKFMNSHSQYENVIVIVDDMRFINEFRYIQAGNFNSVTVRLKEYHGFIYKDFHSHESETSLDDVAHDIYLAPEYRDNALYEEALKLTDIVLNKYNLMK